MKCPKCKEGVSLTVRFIKRTTLSNTKILCQELVIAGEAHRAYFLGKSVLGSCTAQIFRSRVDSICPYCSFEYDWIIGDDVLEKKQ